MEEPLLSNKTSPPKGGISYLKKLILWYDTKHHSFPSMEWLKKKTDFESPEQLIEALKFLSRKEFLIKLPSGEFLMNPDFTQIEEKEKEWLPEKFQQEETQATPIIEEKPTIQKKKAKEIPSKVIQKSQTISFTRILFGIIGTGTAYMSMYYSALWFGSFLDPFRAWIMAIVTVLFSAGCFEMILLFALRRSYLVATGFGILFLVVLFLSMFSTLAGQYTGHMDRIKKEYSEYNQEFKESLELTQWKEQKVRYENQLKEIDEDNKRLLDSLSRFQSIEEIQDNKRLYNQLTNGKTENDLRRRNLIQTLEKMEGEKPKEELKQERPNVYKWLGDMFRISPELLQFWISVLPAIFIDMMVPVSLTVVVFGGFTFKKGEKK